MRKNSGIGFITMLGNYITISTKLNQNLNKKSHFPLHLPP